MSCDAHQGLKSVVLCCDTSGNISVFPLVQVICTLPLECEMHVSYCFLFHNNLDNLFMLFSSEKITDQEDFFFHRIKCTHCDGALTCMENTVPLLVLFL